MCFSKNLINEGLGLCDVYGEGELYKHKEQCGYGSGDSHAIGLMALMMLPLLWAHSNGNGVAAALVAVRVLPQTWK